MASYHSHPQDAQIISRFEAIYIHTYFRLSQFVYRFIRDKEQAKDILQEVYTTLWEQLPTISDDEKAHPLLRTYATNIMINRIKKTARSKKRETIFYSNQELHNMPEAALDLKETVQFFHEALNHMPSQQKIVLQLSIEEGLTHKEIAEKLKISARTSKYLLAQAKLFLKKQLRAGSLVLIILLTNLPDL